MTSCSRLPSTPKQISTVAPAVMKSFPKTNLLSGQTTAPSKQASSNVPRLAQSGPRPASPSLLNSTCKVQSIQSTKSPTSRQQPPYVLQTRPNLSNEVVTQVEELILHRRSNRHDYSTRKPIPFKILKDLSNDQFINQQHNVKTLWINDRTKIQRIAKWAELVDQAIYSSKRLSVMLLSSIAQKESDANRAIPLQSLELSLMQMTNFLAFSQTGHSEETIKLMKSNITMARSTSRKMLSSAGLAVVCYQGGAPSWQTLMRVGQTIMAILLKLSKHDISTSIWGNSGAMDLLRNRFAQGVSDPHMVALYNQVSNALNNVQEQLKKARLVMPELSDNEGVISIIRFGYALQESSQSTERVALSKSVTVL